MTPRFPNLLLLLVILMVLVPLRASGRTFLETFLDSTAVLPRHELRAAWVVRYALNSQSDIDQAVDFAARARFHLLFVQVRGRGDAYYRSELEPVASSLEVPIDTFDPLEYFLGRAHDAGIAVHVWINMCYVWSDGVQNPPADHIVRRHPEWLMADVSGVRMDARPVREWQRQGLEGYYVSPGDPAVREHTARVVKDIVTRYPVDGVHLDYIRYPGANFDFSDRERSRFALAYGIDPLRLERKDRSLLAELGADTALFDSLRVEWRVAQVDSMVRAVRDVIGGLPLSAAVIPDLTTARLEKGQDWLRWVQEGLVDFVVPMTYYQAPAELTLRVQTIKRSIGTGRFLVGLPVFDGRGQYLGYSVSMLRREGVLGYSIFSYNVLAQERFSLDFLERVFFGPDDDEAVEHPEDEPPEDDIEDE